MTKPHAITARSIKVALGGRTVKEIRKSASQLAILGQNDAPFDEIEQAALRLMKGHFELVPSFSIASLYRGRIWDRSTPPDHVSELLALPAVRVTQYGRVNIPGQSVLYVSEFVQTVLNELRLAVDDEVILIRLRKIGDSPRLRISDLGMLPQKTDYRSLSDGEREIFKMVGGTKHYRNLIEIRRKIADFSKAPVAEDKRSLYKITAAISQPHFLEPEIHGVRYPSVETRHKLVNFALKPSVVDCQFTPDSVAWMLIKGRDYDYHDVDTLKTGTIDASGRLIWDDSIVFEDGVLPPQYGSPEITRIDRDPIDSQGRSRLCR